MKKESAPKSIKELEKEGSEWYIDRYESIKVERNRYFLLLLICVVTLLFSILASLMLFPLKTAVPYVIEIDKLSGATSVLDSASHDKITEKEAVTVYFLYQYLNARMDYDYNLRQANAAIVRALSSAETYRKYVQTMDTNNPESPIKKYKDTAVIDSKIISHSFPYPNIAQIRFYTELKPNTVSGLSKEASTKRYYSATIKYTYANIQLASDDRQNLNPLGFFVTSFQLSEEMPQGNAEK